MRWQSWPGKGGHPRHTTSVYLRATAAHLHDTVRAAPTRGLLTSFPGQDHQAPG